MSDSWLAWPVIIPAVLHLVLVLGFSIRVLLRDDMAPDARMAWIMVILLLPYAGCGLYFLLGRIDLGQRAFSQHRRGLEAMRSQLAEARDAARVLGVPADLDALIDMRWRSVFRYAASINGFSPVPGNRGELMADGDQARARLLADLESARHEIHLLYYIWLDDGTGTAVAQALMRAAQRGVVCRVMVDGLGSRAFLRSPLWQQMRQAGVQTAVALPIDHPLRVMLTSRIDLRNHRKITLIDGRITYCGSQNCADAAFRVKARFAPWVDIMLRLQGPVVAQMQLLFVSDWAQATGEVLKLRLCAVGNEAASASGWLLVSSGAAAASAGQGSREEYGAADGGGPGFVGQVVGDGPTERLRSTPQLIATLMASARERMSLSTPYFVPDATVMDALCAAALRGVAVTMIMPKRNDSWIVAAASRSNYGRLLAAGVRIHEYRDGLLHAKTLTIDGQLSFIGSTNLDLRSFDLNFENNVLLQDEALTTAIEARQHAYLARSDEVTLASVRQWSRARRIWNNVLATLGPVL